MMNEICHIPGPSNFSDLIHSGCPSSSFCSTLLMPGAVLPQAFVLGVSLCLEGFSSRNHKPCALTSPRSLLKFHLFSEDFYTSCLNHNQPLTSLSTHMHFPYPLSSAFSDHLSLPKILFILFIFLISRHEGRDFSFFCLFVFILH